MMQLDCSQTKFCRPAIVSVSSVFTLMCLFAVAGVSEDVVRLAVGPGRGRIVVESPCSERLGMSHPGPDRATCRRICPDHSDRL